MTAPADTLDAPRRRPTRVTFRRRVDKHVLRWQARMDGEWADRVVPSAAAIALFVLFASLSLATVRSIETPVDLASAVQGTWLLSEGVDPVVTIDGSQHVLARQAAFVMIPIGLVGRFVPLEPMLLVLQAAALAAAVIPLWWIARRHAHLRAGAALTLVVVYALYPAVHNLNLSGFHPEVLAMPALLGAMFFGLGARWRPFAACAVFVVLCRADLGLAVAGLGGLLAWRGERRAGAITAAFGIGWTILAVGVIQPLVTEGGTAHLEAFAAYGDTLWGVAWGMLTHPVEVLGDLVDQANFELFVILFAPVLFLPLLAPRFLVPVLPLQFLYLVSDVPNEARVGQQTVAITAFIFLATAIALAGFGRKGIEKVTVDGRLLGALVLAAAVFFVQDATSSPYQEPWAWGASDAADDARRAVADEVPDDAAVRASPTVVILVAQRPEVYVVPGGGPDARAIVADVDAVLLDRDDHPKWTDRQWTDLASDLRAEGFREAAAEETVQLWVRSGP